MDAFTVFSTIKRSGFKRDVFLIASLLLNNVSDIYRRGEMPLVGQPALQGFDHLVRVWAAHCLEVCGNAMMREFWPIKDDGAVPQPTGAFLDFSIIKSGGIKRDVLLGLFMRLALVDLADTQADVYRRREMPLVAQPVFQGFDHLVRVWAAHCLEVHDNLRLVEFLAFKSAIKDGGAVLQPTGAFLDFFAIKRGGFRHGVFLVRVQF